MGIVRGPQHLVPAEALQHVGQRLLVHLAGEEDVAAADDVAGALLHRQGTSAPFPVLVQRVHHERHPAGAALQVGHPQVGKAVVHAGVDHAHDLHHLRHGVLQRARLRQTVEHVQQAGGRAAVHRQRTVQPLGFRVEGIEAAASEALLRRHHRRDHARHHAQVLHAPAQLRHRGVDVLHRQQRHALEPVRLAPEAIVQPVVVGLGHRHRPALVADLAVEQRVAGVEDGLVDLRLVEEAQPVGRVRHLGLVARRHAAHPAVGEGEEVVLPGPVLLVPGGRQIVAQVLVLVHHVAVGVDDVVFTFHDCLHCRIRGAPRLSGSSAGRTGRSS